MGPLITRIPFIDSRKIRVKGIFRNLLLFSIDSPYNAKFTLREFFQVLKIALTKDLLYIGKSLFKRKKLSFENIESFVVM